LPAEEDVEHLKGVALHMKVGASARPTRPPSTTFSLATLEPCFSILVVDAALVRVRKRLVSSGHFAELFLGALLVAVGRAVRVPAQRGFFVGALDGALVGVRGASEHVVEAGLADG
jgi:hypothetical protein